MRLAVVGFALLAFSCGSAPAASRTDVPAAPAIASATCERPYSTSSPWNTPIRSAPRGSSALSDYGTLFGAGYNKRMLWRASDGKLLAQLGQNLLATGSAPANGWHHVVYSFDGQSERFYINGQAAGQQASSVASWSTSFSVGALSFDLAQYPSTARWTRVRSTDGHARQARSRPTTTRALSRSASYPAAPAGAPLTYSRIAPRSDV